MLLSFVGYVAWYFTLFAASGDAFGIAYLGGACYSWKQYKTVVMEWDHNDLVVARVSYWKNKIVLQPVSKTAQHGCFVVEILNC